MLPDIDGLASSGDCGKTGSSRRLIVSALGEIDDRVRGLRAGATTISSAVRCRGAFGRVDALAAGAIPRVKETVLRVGDCARPGGRARVTRSGREIALLPAGIPGA